MIAACLTASQEQRGPWVLECFGLSRSWFGETRVLGVFASAVVAQASRGSCFLGIDLSSALFLSRSFATSRCLQALRQLVAAGCVKSWLVADGCKRLLAGGCGHQQLVVDGWCGRNCFTLGVSALIDRNSYMSFDTGCFRAERQKLVQVVSHWVFLR